MSKYDPLYEYLLNCDHSVTLTFDEIERILGCELPYSAKEYTVWWANEDVDTTSHVHCRSWQDAGFKTIDLDLKNETVTFEKVK